MIKKVKPIDWGNLWDYVCATVEVTWLSLSIVIGGVACLLWSGLSRFLPSRNRGH